MPLSQGQVLKNRYRIVQLLSTGGFGTVYRAWDMILECPVALKESLEQDPEARRQFSREAQILAKLNHQNLPRVTDFFTLPGAGQYLVMDFIEGRDMEELMNLASGPLYEKQALEWIDQVCDALVYLHSQKPPVIHRDIKPANIKIVPPSADHPQARAMLVDFGVAKVYDLNTKTTAGARAITPGYSPFEQYGHGTTDARSDVYALGATLYTLLTGQVPVESVQRMPPDPLIPPRKLVHSISSQVETALLKALTMDPDERFQSIGEFKSALQGMPGSWSRPKSTLPRVWSWLGLGVGLLTLAALVANMLGLFPWASIPERPTLTSRPLAGVVTTALAVTHTLTPDRASPVQTPTPYPSSPTSGVSAPLPGPFLLVATEISPVDGMLQSYIPAGTFQMGDDNGYQNEGPMHSVTLDAFWMDMTEVTNGMYAQCVAAGACRPPRNSSSSTHSNYYGNAAYTSYPVIFVSWFQASEYCAWAGRRLPTEAEWEYAARGGLVGMRFPWGDDVDGSLANFCDANCELDDSVPEYNDGYADTAPVGSYPPNGYGLYDMAGNVEEWVADWFSEYSSASVVNPTGPQYGGSRIYRGGSWADRTRLLETNSRDDSEPGRITDSWGFRCARSAAASEHPVVTATPYPTVDGSLLDPASGRIAFVAYLDNNADIYTINANGSGLIRLTNTESLIYGPVWSPDGNRVAFFTGYDYTSDIYVINADGSDQTNLSNNATVDACPSWSSDGRQIAFISLFSNFPEIFIMNSDGSGLTQLTQFELGIIDIDWSPDGSQIIFASYLQGLGGLYTYTIADSELVQLTNNEYFDNSASWSPDGRQIVFTSGRDGNSEIFLMNADGSGQVNLTNLGSVDHFPTWSPDGRWIAFSSNRDGSYEIYIMRADGSDVMQLTHFADERILMPDWGP